MPLRAHSLRIFIPSLILTIVVGILTAWLAGLGSLWLFIVLVILEITFSFDNAVINSKVLTKLSPFWQQLFLTVGILFAVFIIRFVLPIVIVASSAGMDFASVIRIALDDPQRYAHILHGAAPTINAFGGAFLVMVALSFFLDRDKDIHWISAIEQHLVRFAHNRLARIIVIAIIIAILVCTVDTSIRMTVFIAAAIGVVLHVILGVFSRYFAGHQPKGTHLVGMAAFASFIYLNVLDASFSLDGVIGAFAITPDIILIMAGLGAGALWVRSLTIYLVRAKTLGRYRYLEHGAHWAILALGIIMFVKLYHIEPPEWFTGGIGLAIIVVAIITSIVANKRELTN